MSIDAEQSTFSRHSRAARGSPSLRQHRSGVRHHVIHGHSLTFIPYGGSMKQAHKRLMACSIAGVGVLLMAAIAWADMGKTAPALPAPSGSKAESAIKEGMMHYEQGHWDVAKKHFEKAVHADDQSAESHYDLALALDKAGDHQAAI